MSSDTFSFSDRAAMLEQVQSSPLDLAIIGGGITGAGILWDAALRGLSVGLFERGDFASGTSSCSSKLIHGGLRYLEQLKFGLVTEATAERALLGKLAPHLVKPIEWLFTVYKKDKHSRWVIGAGLWLYEALARFRIQRHRSHGAKGALRLEPWLQPEGLRGGIVYFDSMTDDARLTLETVMAGYEHGGLPLSYAQLEAIEGTGPYRLEVLDQVAGQRFTVEARTVINAAGPWADRVRKLIDGDCRRVVRPTKGVHFVVDKRHLPVSRAVVMSSVEDGRPLFVIPWPDATYVGTTDTDVGKDIDEDAATASDVSYLLKTTNYYFPQAALTEDHIMATWSGTRPLVEEENLPPSSVSREHQIFADTAGVITIVGGKLTTYRRMAADALACALQQLGMVRPCTTDSCPLPGNDDFAYEQNRVDWVRDLTSTTAIDDAQAQHIVAWYGARYRHVRDRLRATPDLMSPIIEGKPFVWAELAYALEHEMVLTIGDFLNRRTSLMLTTRDQALGVATEVASRMAEFLGWDEAERERQLQQYRHEVQKSRRFRQAE